MDLETPQKNLKIPPSCLNEAMGIFFRCDLEPQGSQAIEINGWRFQLDEFHQIFT